MCGFAPTAAAQSLEELRDLAIEDLGRIQITSVSKRPELLSEAPAAIYVISNEEIRRSGALTLPEALRLAPNLHVARQNALNYAISARGLNSFEASNKLLVLVDGRSVYSPLHSGVFWDQQQIMLADVDRIEVVSGPGGTLWGSNAVNGVINVITRNARETQGGLVDLNYGTVDRAASARFGGRIGESGAYRVYGMGFDFGHTELANGSAARDDWQARQAGFRTDWGGSTGDRLTLQGDLFDNPVDKHGGRLWGRNLLARWTRPLENGGAVELQTYYDAANRSGPGVRDSRETFDIQAQHAFSLGESHRIVWGGGHRVNDDQFDNQGAFVLSPAGRTLQLTNLFAQDTVTLTDDVKLTFGTKLEYSDYTGLEYMPSVRLGWRLSDADFVWSAVSRSVRTPSRIDRDLIAPGVFAGGPTFKSEKLVSYELGYRGRPTASSGFSVSLFLNDYDDIRTTGPGPGGGLLRFNNDLEGETFGIEAWGEYRPLPWWRLSAGGTAIHKDLRVKSGATDLSRKQAGGNDPGFQLQLRSAIDLGEGIQFDVGLRWVDALEVAVPGYVAADLRLGWRVTDGLELSLTAFNLFDGEHAEAGTSAAALRQIRRSLLLGARVRF